MNGRISIIFMITDHCNCKCFFCSRNNLSQHYNNPKFDDCCRVFDTLSHAYPLSKLVISGGEPTLSEDFFAILNYVTPLFDKVEIQTNGTFNKEIANQLKPLLSKNVYLQFSLDGGHEKHDSIRGHGTFQQVIENLQYLQKYHTHLSISTTVTPFNIEDIISLARYLNNFQFRRLTVSYVQPLNPIKERILSAYQWNQFVDDLLAQCFYRVDVSKLYDFNLMEKFLDSGKEWHGIVNCGRGITHFYVTPTFDVLPCTCTDFKVGNLITDSILDIKQKLAAKETVCINTASVCRDCKYLTICNGGCPGLSLKVFGSENMGDIRCPKVFEFATNKGLLSQHD